MANESRALRVGMKITIPSLGGGECEVIARRVVSHDGLTPVYEPSKVRWSNGDQTVIGTGTKWNPA